MNNAQNLVDEIRRELQPIADQLRGHPYVAAIEEGRVGREQLRLFAGEQYAIIGSDLRSVAHLVGRFAGTPSLDFFLAVLEGERTAWRALATFGRALGMSEADLEGYDPLPGAQAYACAMAQLALFGTDAAVAAAYLVNFPAWGDNCGRLGRGLRRHYGMSEADVAFFEFFATPSPDFERAALEVIERGLERGVEPRAVRRAVRLLQAYELMYWDQLEAAPPHPR